MKTIVTLILTNLIGTINTLDPYISTKEVIRICTVNRTTVVWSKNQSRISIMSLSIQISKAKGRFSIFLNVGASQSEHKSEKNESCQESKGL